MNKLLLLIFSFSIFFINCSGTKTNNLKSIYFEYSVKNVVTNYEVDITLDGKILSVSYMDIMDKSISKHLFIDQDSISASVYEYVKKNNFSEIPQPEQQNTLDAPMEKLSVNYDSNKKLIDLSRVVNKPGVVKNLISTIFIYIDAKIPNWRKESGME